MMKKGFILLVSLLCCCSLTAQFISGHFRQLANQPVRLEGFNGLQTYLISNTVTGAKGDFKLSYAESDYGMGYLISSENKPVFVILNGENVVLEGENLSNMENLHVLQGQENQFFERYASEHPRREQTMSTWAYLEKIYALDTLFATQKASLQAIQAEKQRIKNEDDAQLASLPEGSYVNWYLPVRKMLSSVSTVVQYRPEEIPAYIAAFRQLDYTDKRLYKSGLFKDAIEGHYWLLENCGKSPDSVFIEMKTSIDGMITNLTGDEIKLNEVTDYLFNLLEKQSLFRASEYLALQVLNKEGCTVNNNLAGQLETYRAMKKGNIAPDIIFKEDVYSAGYKTADLPKRLSDIKTKYTLVVFGASWCPKCTEELPAIARLYAKWKANQVEVVFVSLDEKKEEYRHFTKLFPFISICDYKKWEGEVVRNYYVFGTPTLYLLNEQREILLRPHSVNQMDAWVDWFLVQGNPLPR